MRNSNNNNYSLALLRKEHTERTLKKLKKELQTLPAKTAF